MPSYRVIVNLFLTRRDCRISLAQKGAGRVTPEKLEYRPPLVLQQSFMAQLRRMRHVHGTIFEWRKQVWQATKTKAGPSMLAIRC